MDAVIQDAVVAKQYKEDPAAFLSTAKFWTETYASGMSVFADVYRPRHLLCSPDIQHGDHVVADLMIEPRL